MLFNLIIPIIIETTIESNQVGSIKGVFTITLN